MTPSQTKETFPSSFLAINTPRPSIHPSSSPLGTALSSPPCPTAPTSGADKGQTSQAQLRGTSWTSSSLPHGERAEPFGNGTENSLFLFPAKAQGTNGAGRGLVVHPRSTHRPFAFGELC